MALFISAHRAGRIAAALILGACSVMAHAQATRTWVSGVGDDVNPCSRTAPCKTWAGAISKTAPGGEISAMDPGGFGTVTITKSITLDGGAGQVASILATGTNGVNVNAGANDHVVLRNLSINGAGTTLGVNGVRFVGGKTLRLQNVSIERFSDSCISIEPSATAATVQILQTVTSNCGKGLNVASPASPPVAITVGVDRSRFLFHSTGVLASGANAVVQLSGSTVFGNATGLSALSQAGITSSGNNQTQGNTANGAFTGTTASN